ncbi:unnamed protein product [Closterium sp. Naga37s-1]|nr:unnamed protein product [Closterium sp. Naga37s-1]
MALLPGDRGYEEPSRGFGQPSGGFEDPSHSYHVPSGRNVQDQENSIVGQLQYYGDLVGGMARGDEKGMERGGRAMEEEGFAVMGAGLGETEADRPAHMGNHLDALMEDAEAEEALGLHQQPLQCMAPPLPTTGMALERCASLSTTEKCLEMLDADSARGHEGAARD